MDDSHDSRMGNTPHPAIATPEQIKRIKTLLTSRRINQQIRTTFEDELRKGITASRARELMTWLQSRPLVLNRKAIVGGIRRIDPRDLD